MKNLIYKLCIKIIEKINMYEYLTKYIMSENQQYYETELLEKIQINLSDTSIENLSFENCLIKNATIHNCKIENFTETNCISSSCTYIANRYDNNSVLFYDNNYIDSNSEYIYDFENENVVCCGSK